MGREKNRLFKRDTYPYLKLTSKKKNVKNVFAFFLPTQRNATQKGTD